MSRRASRWTLVAIVASAACAGGCALQAKPGAESIFDVLVFGPSPLDYTQMAQNEYDANERYLGTLGLAREPFASEPIYLDLFVTNARDEDPSVRAAALRGLAYHGRPEHAAVLVEALTDTDRNVRLEAARGLQRLHDPAVVRALLGAIREPDLRETLLASEPEADVRLAAVSALAQYRTNDAFRGLVGALEDSVLSVSRGAQESLRTLTGQDFGRDRAAWFDWFERTRDPFFAGTIYHYPAYHRARRFYEYFPLVPQPPNEISAPPAGMPLTAFVTPGPAG